MNTNAITVSLAEIRKLNYNAELSKLGTKIDKYNKQLSWLEHLDFLVNVADNEDREEELRDQHRRVAKTKEKIYVTIKKLGCLLCPEQSIKGAK